MLEDAIALIEKQIELYRVQNSRLKGTKKKYTAQNIVKNQLKEEIKIRKYILKVLQERREQDASKEG